MITIVIAYFERQVLLEKTLDSFKKYNPKEFNVIIVDNGSEGDVVLPELSYDVEVVKITGMPGHCVFTFNVGFSFAIKRSDIIIMQGAECCHNGNILKRAKEITNEMYISFGCYSLGQGESIDTVKINNRCQTFDGDSAWYNHPIYNPRGFNFCSAITTENLIKLNGFDERFGYGCGYEDDYFLHQLRKLGLKIELTLEPFVFHQWHPTGGKGRELESWHRNLALFTELSKGNEYKAQHTLTSDL